MNYYNEHDPMAAAWLRQLIADGLIPPGVVDERSIVDVKPSELNEFTQCHFFAGIGGWSLALQIAGWPATRRVWTGSCPCQPFSHAGKGKGVDDERHLWPAFKWLIEQCRPSIVFGEQVASKAGRDWLAGVFADLEGMGYQRAAADLCAAGVGSPHIRQRLFWMANARWPRDQLEFKCGRPHGQSEETERKTQQRERGRTPTSDCCEIRGVANTDQHGQQPGEPATAADRHRHTIKPDGGSCGLGNAEFSGLEGHAGDGHSAGQRGRNDARQARPATPAGRDCWGHFDLTPCGDGKTRRIEPGLAPLAHGVPARMVRLRGYGNAIVPEAAAVFIEACEDAIAIEGL